MNACLRFSLTLTFGVTLLAGAALPAWTQHSGFPLYLQPVQVHPPVQSHNFGAIAAVGDHLYAVQESWGIAGFVLDQHGSPLYPNPHVLDSRSPLLGHFDIEDVDGDALVAWTAGNSIDDAVIRCALQTLTDWTRPTRQIITIGAGHDPAVEAADDAGIVVWVGSDRDLLGVRLEASSWPSTPTPIPISHGPGLGHPDLAYAAETGSFLAVWQRDSTVVEARLIDPQGIPTGPVLTIATSAALPTVTWDGGHFIVVLSVAGAVEAIRLLPDGTPADPAPIAVAPAPTRFARAGSRPGETLVAWITGSPADPTYEVRAARIDAQGRVLDPEGMLLHEAARKEFFLSPENQVTSVVWSGVQYEVMWSENQPTCAGDIVLDDILLSDVVPGEPPHTSPARFAFGSHIQWSLVVASLGESFWTAWFTPWRRGDIGKGARWSLTDEGVTLLDPEGINLALAKNWCPGYGWEIRGPVVVSGGRGVLTAMTECLWSYGRDCNVGYSIRDATGERVASGGSDVFPTMSDPAIASDGERFLIAYVAETLYDPPQLRWFGVDRTGMALDDLTSGDFPAARVFDAASNGTGYLVAWASATDQDEIVIGHFDSEFRLVQQHSVSAPGPYVDGLHLASDGERYLATVAGRDSLSAILLSEDGEVLGTTAFAQVTYAAFAFDVQWDHRDYVLAWTDRNLMESAVRVRRFGTDGDPRDPEPVDVLRLPEPLYGCSMANFRDGLSVIATARANRTGHGLLYRNPGPVPVELVSFDALAAPGSAILRWTMGREESASGFHVLRSTTPEREHATRRTSALILAGQHSYQFVDHEMTSRPYWYWLEEIARNGERTWHGPRMVTLPAPRATLAQNTPNPFQGTTQISFLLPADGRVTLGIYSVRGHLVRSLFSDEQFGSGEHRVLWDGTDDRRRTAAAGVYICRFQFGDVEIERKLQLIR